MRRTVMSEGTSEGIDAVAIESNHTIEIDKFVPLSDIDERYFDSPYYIVPMTTLDRKPSQSSARR